METKRMNEIYAIIANKVNDMIPEEWENVWLYAEVLEDASEVYFYFEPSGSENIVYSHDIPDIYNVDEDVYDDLLFELIDVIGELYLEFKNNNEIMWSNLTFKLEKSGGFNINFNYEDVLNSEFTSGERQIIWEYEVLGIEPDEEDKEMLNRYLMLKEEK